MLTNEQCHVFRILPVSFNDMVRAIFEAGREAQRESDAKICDAKATVMWAWWDSRADPTDQGQAMAADDLSELIRANKGD